MSITAGRRGGRAALSGVGVMTVTAVAVPRSTAIPFAVVEITPEARAAAVRALRGGWVTTGPEVAAFENEFAALVGARHAVGVSSCTAALQVALRALELPPGARVLTPSMTFAGAVHAILQAGLQPVLVDIDPETLMPAPEHVAAAAERGPRPQAMVVLHFAGAPAGIFAMADAARLPLERVVEDAAHGLWTRAEGRDVGTLSGATCFSFYATKNLPLGEGGMVTTDDDRIASYIRCARLHGMSKDAWRRYLPGGTWRYDIEIAGIKANMTDVTAAIGRAQLAHLATWQRRREQIAARYRRGLAHLPGIRLPIDPPIGDRHSWHLFVIQVERDGSFSRDTVAAGLAEAEIGFSVHFIPVHHLHYFRELLGDHAGLLPGTDEAADRVLSLPMHPRLSDADVDRVCEVVTDAVRAPR
jgi:dTDP-4-amino-4,6-dideoxygalactose transaminase